MKFGNASWGFRETPLEEQLKITKGLGLEVLELGIANAPKDLPLDTTDAELDNVKKLYEKYGIELCCASTGNDFSCGNKDDVAKIKRVTDMSAKLGIKYLRIFAGFSPVTSNRFSKGPSLLMALYSSSICSGVRMVRAIGLLIWKPQYTQELVQELVIYSGINMEMVLPKRSSVYFLLSCAIGSRYFAAAGEMSAIKSSTSQCSLPRARSTSLSVLE